MDAAVRADTERLLADLAATLPARGRVLIIPHDYPDPDALASSAALQLLLHVRWRLHGQILFSGLVSRAENRELLRHFKYRWIAPAQWKGGPRPRPAIFVDTAPWHGNVTVPGFARAVAVFDHHDRGKRALPEGLLTVFSPALGAMTTRFFELLTVAGVAIPKWLASLMTYAVTTETFDFVRHGTPRDVEAYTTLLARCNLKTLGGIKNAALPGAYYGYLVEAVQHAQLYGCVTWTHLESVSQPEIVAEIADLLLRRERITWAFCTAFQEDRLLVSLRSERLQVNCGRLLRTLIPRRDGSAGGHDQTAAGFVDVTGLVPEARRQRREALVTRLIHAIAGRPPLESARPLLG